MNRREAKAHWQRSVATWSAWGEAFAAEIPAIEDPLLRFAVAATVDSVASGGASVAIRRIDDRQVGLVGFYMDFDVIEIIEARLAEDGAEDPSQLLRDADVWIRNRLNTTPILQVAWLFRNLQNVAIDPSVQYRWIEHQNIVYSVVENRFLGVRHDDGMYKIQG